MCTTIVGFTRVGGGPFGPQSRCHYSYLPLRRDLRLKNSKSIRLKARWRHVQMLSNRKFCCSCKRTTSKKDVYRMAF